MKLYSENKDYKLYQGNMLDMLEVIEPQTIDSIVTDPPYGLTSITKRSGKEGSAPASTKNNDGSFARLSKGFMGKEWDGSGIEYNIDTWKKCYEVLKPGGYLLAFGGSRTFHRIACAIEDAGFEIRDTIMWLYGSGFPKSMNIGLAIDKKNGQATNEWQGWGTALKPSFEPIIVARKPFKGSLVDNVIEHGVGGINIDECRVGQPYKYHIKENGFGDNFMDDNWKPSGNEYDKEVSGRFPANTILTYDETDFDEVCGGFPITKPAGNKIGKEINKNLDYNASSYKLSNNKCPKIAGDNGGSASRYFYCAKASKKDRNEGLDDFEDKVKVFNGKSNESSNDMKDVEKRFTTIAKNTHPTVKPTDLMQYLVRLVSPNGATILDPFNGSGSTGKAVMYENKERNKNYKYIGIELTEEYLPIAKARIEYVYNDNETLVENDWDLSDLD